MLVDGMFTELQEAELFLGRRAKRALEVVAFLLGVINFVVDEHVVRTLDALITLCVFAP